MLYEFAHSLTHVLEGMGWYGLYKFAHSLTHVLEGMVWAV